MKLLISLCIISCLWAKPQQPENVERAKSIIQKLFPYSSKLGKGIKTKSCQINKKKWLLLLISKQSFTEQIKFNTQCDLKGQYTAQMETPFPVHFVVKDIPHFTNIKFKMKLSLKYSPSAQIHVDLLDGILHGPKKKILFSGVQQLEIDPFSAQIVKKQIKGEITIHQIDQKKYSLKLPIQFKNKG